MFLSRNRLRAFSTSCQALVGSMWPSLDSSSRPSALEMLEAIPEYRISLRVWRARIGVIRAGFGEATLLHGRERGQGILTASPLGCAGLFIACLNGALAIDCW